MSVSDEIRRIQNAKANIKTSIENKGVTVPDDAKLDAFPALIDDIQAGGSGETHVNPDFYELRTKNGTNFDYLFKGYNGPYIDVSKWDTSKVTSAQYCFSNCTKSMDISNWDLSSLTNASYMFDNFSNNNKYMDLSVLDFSSVTNEQYMFMYSNTDYLDVRNINLTGTTNYSNLFYYCYGNEVDLSAWDISKVTDMSHMFDGSYFTKIDLTGWNTANVKNFSYMFYGYSSKLKKLIIPDWDMTNATSTSNFIYNSRSPLKYIDLSRSNDLTIKKIASFLPTKTATTYGEVVIPSNTSQDAIDALTAKYWKPIGPKIDINSTELALELDEIKPGKTTKIFNGNNDPWYGDDRPETIEFISSDESVATINGREITGVAEGTVTITCRRREDNVIISTAPVTLTVSETDSKPNLIKFRTNGSEGNNDIIVVNGTRLTKSKLTYDSISKVYSYDPGEQITNIKFAYSYSYTYINELVKFNFNATNITNTNGMFAYYKGTTLDLSGWDTSNVTDMQTMFIGSSIEDLNITGWDTSNVTNMNYMFQDAEKLKNVIGVLDFSSLKGYPAYFFNKSIYLETIYLKNIYKNVTTINSSIYNIVLSYTKVKDECLIYIINELPNLHEKNNTTSNIKLYLPPTNTLTAEQVQPAIDKGWQVYNTTY